MSSRDQALAALLANVTTAWDGVLAGLALALFAVQRWAKYRRSSAALAKLRCVPSVRISDLSSIIVSDNGPSSFSSGISSLSGGRKLVVVRGEVQPKPRKDAGSNSKNSGVLVSQGSGEKAVIIQRTSTCLYSEWRGIFGLSIDLHAIFAKTWKEQQSNLLRTVPFILVEDGQCPNAGFVNVKLEGSMHPLPLMTNFHQLLPVQATTYTFFQATLGHGYPVALLEEEKVLPIGEKITAMGVCNFQDGVLEIEPSRELPFFLSNFTKDEIEATLAARVNVLFWSGVLIGALSVVILSYSMTRNWRRLRGWRSRRRLDQGSRASVSEAVDPGEYPLRLDRDSTISIAETIPDDDEDSEDVPERALCVICLTRMRRCAFLPCGHLVCCVLCAAAVKRGSSPRCPVCRESTPSFIRIYES